MSTSRTTRPNECKCRHAAVLGGTFAPWLAGLLTVIALACQVAIGGDASASALVLSVLPEVREVPGEQLVGVHFELENRGKEPVYICQWPGIAFGGAWSTADGETQGFGPGSPSSRPLSRKYFIELKPGEALLGHGTVRVFPNKAGEILLVGRYRSGDMGRGFGVQAWTGEILSDPVRIGVPKR